MSRKTLFGAAIALVFALAMPFTAFAADTTTSSAGSLSVVCVSEPNNADLTDGATVNDNWYYIKPYTLTFSQNISGRDIAVSNQEKVVMTDANGNEVPCSVSIARTDEAMANDNTTPCEVNVVPNARLTSGATYTITAKAGIVSSDGSTLKNDYSISFKVGDTTYTHTCATPAASSADMYVVAAVIVIVVAVAIAVVVLLFRKKGDKALKAEK